MRKYATALILMVFTLFLLCSCGAGERINVEMPLFIKTIDRPDSGVGEVILGTLRISGRWSADDAGAKFSGIMGTAGLEDYGEPYHDPRQDVEVTFAWESGHWVGTIPYTSANNEAKILTVYTDEAHAVWVFESEDRISFAPADHIKEVLAICETLGMELK